MPQSRIDDNRLPRPPRWRPAATTDFPPEDRCLAWMEINFARVRRTLSASQAVRFAIDPADQLAFVRYFVCRIGVPVGFRMLVRKREVWIYPRPWRRVTHPERPRTRAVLAAGFRERLRVDALIRVICADAGEYAQSVPSGFDWRTALASFIEQHRDHYGIEIPDVDTLESWLNSVERFELLDPSPVRRSDAGGNADGGTTGRASDAASPERTLAVQEAASS